MAYDWNPYAAGKKVYGLAGRPNPTNGPLDRWGYVQRDRRAFLKRQAMQTQLKNLKKMRQTGANYGLR